jgi:hypothetical protein
MVWRIIRGRGFVPVVLILAAILYWKIYPRPPKVISVGYVADRGVILWNSLAQVRESVGEVHYGDRVEVVRVEGPASQVRTASGTLGWIRDSRQIMDSELWAETSALLERARTLPVQARGRTKTVSNVRVEPGRDAERVFQFMRGTPVLILERAVADAPQTTGENLQNEKAPATEELKPRQEDWLLVLRAGNSPANDNRGGSPYSDARGVKDASGNPVSGGPSAALVGAAAMNGPAGQVAGWVLARFIDLDLPGPVRDYASSAGLHVVAWFELDRVPDGSGGEAPQYLVAGSRGEEGQTCDFTLLRVYTWSKARKRYETAYVESNLCGRLPIRVSRGVKGPEFQFSEADGGAGRTYVMQLTTVRRVKEAAMPPEASRN